MSCRKALAKLDKKGSLEIPPVYKQEMKNRGYFKRSGDGFWRLCWRVDVFSRRGWLDE